MNNILRRLSMTDAVSGNEMYITTQLFGETVKKYNPHNMPLIDALGNLTLFRKGKSSDKTVALIAHTDEAGFIVKDVTENGFIKFEAVGKIDPRVIISKKVNIGKNGVKGIIGMKAIHLQKREERETVVPIKDLFIDIGAKNKKKALKKINIGDYISFSTEFKYINNDILKGKALDRMGMYCLSELIELQPDYDTYYIFAAQKHVGARGALVALERILPDYAFIIDAVETADMYRVKPHCRTAALHAGAILSPIDLRGIADKELFQKVTDCAKQANIKYQIAQAAPDASETGIIRSSYNGTKAMLIGIPCRYTNSPVSLMAYEDIESVISLLKTLI